MADMSRVQKLASARKKLKQFQKGKKPATANPEAGSDTVKENKLATSTTNSNLEIEQTEQYPKLATSTSNIVIEQTDQYSDAAKKAKCSDDTKDSLQNHSSSNENKTGHLFHELNHNYGDTADPFSNFEPIEKSSISNSSQSNEVTQLNNLDKSDYSLPTAAETSPLDNTTKQPKLEFSSPSSSTESLRQISLQLNGLMNDSEQFLNGDGENLDYDNKKELELRNQELASTVQYQKQITHQLSSEVQHLKSQNSVLQLQLDKDRQDLESRSLKEQSSLKEQLQVHIQTIGILVAEKTELQSALSQSQRAAKQKTGEVEELDGRLKASRQRITDLDKEIQTTRSTRDQFENNSKEYSKEVDRLKLELYKSKKSSEENSNENSELVQKLQIKGQNSKKLELELTELKKNLSLSELRVQQLSSNNSSGIQSQLEELNETNIELESKVSEYKESFQKLSAERDSLTTQYQQYIQQLNQQITSVRDELNTTVDECRKLSEEKAALCSQIENLNHNSDSSSLGQAKELATENNKLVNEIKDLELKNKQMHEQLESQLQDNNQMSQLMEEKENQLQELEGAISRLQEEEVDKEKLLDTIQSDKVAASRAMAQNKQLKKQLEELQEGFVQMSNDKLELTERMMTQQHMSKELGEQILKQTEEIYELKQNLIQKNQEVEALSKEIYQHNQINDRMRHFEAQGQLSDMLQTELNQAQNQISALTAQNNELRSMLAHQAQALIQKSDNDSDPETKKDSIVASLSASVQQLELERDQLLRQLEEQKLNHSNIHATLKELDSRSVDKVDGVGKVPIEDNSVLKETLDKLEGKLKKTMTQIADLTDQKQQLEHLVLQLQGETETIGDYIALYQVQRGLMKKWAAEKDEYIAQLSRDREELKTKLHQLQALVVNLVNKKQLGNDPSLENFSNLSRSTSPFYNSNISSPALTQDVDSQLTPKEWDALSNVSSDVNPPSTTVLPNSHLDNQARKIMDLISDIGNTALVDKPVLDTFHPCSCCSGRLINV